MSNNCDKCGLDDAECKCYLYQVDAKTLVLEARIFLLEDDVKKLKKLLIEVNTLMLGEINEW